MRSDDLILRTISHLENAGVELAGPPTTSSSDIFDITAFIATRLDSARRQIPSNLRLRILAEELRVLGIKVEFILTNADFRDLESQIRSNLIHKFGEYIRNSFLSMFEGRYRLWLDVKQSIDENVKAQIHDHATKLMDLYDINIDDIVLTKDSNTPGKAAVLATLRRFSPIDVGALSMRLTKQGFSVPSNDWLSRRLDNLRKTGFVIRQRNETYALTSYALTTLGTSRTRRSPDVARILALGRGDD